MENHLTPTADDEIFGADVYLPPQARGARPNDPVEPFEWREEFDAETPHESPNRHLRNTLIVAGAGGVALFAAGTVAGRQVVRRLNR